MLKSRLFRRVVSFVLTGSLLAGIVVSAEPAESDESAVLDSQNNAERDFQQILESAKDKKSAGIMGGSTRSDLYMYYYEQHSSKTRPSREVEIVMGKFDSTDINENSYKVEDYDGKKDCLIWNGDLGGVEYVFDVPESGIYNLEFLYYPIGGNNNSIKLEFYLNGEYPFSATRSIELDKYWKNEGEIKEDAKQNHLLPNQIMYETWITYHVKDKEGLFNEPYFFYLEKGENTVRLEGIQVNGVAFASMTFKNYDEPQSYSEIKPSDSDIKSTAPIILDVTNDIKSNTILMQGETPLWRSSSELIPTYDRGTYQVSPQDPVLMRYNTVGGNGTWGKSGQALTWEFDVPADGYYRFSAKVKQSTLRGFNANRRVLIDGVVPVKEFENQKFGYSPRWYQQSFTTDNSDKKAEEIYIFLKEGTHTLTLEAVPGEIGETMQRLEADLFTLNYYYRRILMITSPNPDEYNPYHVDTAIPELLSEFDRIRTNLRAEKANIEKQASGSEAATLETMAVILDRCIRNPARIPMMQQALKDNIGSLSAWIREASRQPLELDYVEVATYNESFGKAKANFFKQLMFLWEGFIGSFLVDYTKLDDGKGLNVWVGLGRDQALALKHLVDGDFNMTHADSPVTINLVQGSILEATLAGKGPEVATFIGGDFPVQLAARNLTVDLSKFPDYKEIVEERFTEQLPVFFSYLGGVYALPLTQNFPMMFYRIDILEDLGVTPPRSWDEFIDAIAILNRQYLEIGLLPPTSNLSSTIFEPGDTFTLLQLQTGNNFYNEDKTRTTFDSEASVSAFSMWTRFYTVYKFPQTYDPFTRFRTGEMPIVIMPYTFYNQVNAAAPEIRGLWDFQHVPGTVQRDSVGKPLLDEDGKEIINIAASSGASGAIIFNKTPDKENAWDFLKWLTSDDVQTRFGGIMESMLGPLGRYDTANVNALGNLSWSTREIQKLTEQRDALVEIPMIPANYAATRHVKNAFRAVVNENQFPRFALSSYNRDIIAEIERKNRELSSYRKNSSEED
ncbi:MAG: extracellular solute-binding protein [Oscillospiraceae bacterium]|nr:extracellular solute-binding protein [Oscillospiraceae bacterium]